MHVERYGSGPDVFFCIHGWGGSHLTYAPLAPCVPSTASLYAADLPGYGRSPRPHRWSVDAVGEQIAWTLHRIEAPDLTLVGNCSGAIFALVAAMLRPERIRRVVLIDAFAFLPWYFKVFVHPRIGRVAYRSTFANPAGRWMTNASLRSRRASATHLTQSFSRVDHEVSLRYLEMLDAIDGISRFASVPGRIDVAYGERTFAAVKTSARQWQALWPHARQWPLAGAGHLPIVEATQPVASLLFEETS